MSTSTDAILAYGYDLGGEEEWRVEQLDEDGALQLDWFDPEAEDADFIETATDRLLAGAGFTETDWHAPGYFDRKAEAETRVGVEFDTYCSGDYPLYVIAAKRVTVARGYIENLDLAALARDVIELRWDEKLAAALQVLGITPKQSKPGWLLCSYWG